MTEEIQRLRLAGPHLRAARPALHAMLGARSVAIVGASARPDSFGARMIAEVGKSTARPTMYLVNPRYRQIDGRRCYPSLGDLPGPVDLALLGVPDAAIEAQLRLAAESGARSAVIFGSAHEDPPPASAPPAASGQPGAGGQPGNSGQPGAGGLTLRQRLAAIANAAGMELCGAGCMGFANVSHGLRAMGYIEPDPLPTGPIALVTHSGSVFSALLRTRRSIGFTLAVSSGQELVTAAGSYLGYALELPETRVLALVLEAIRQPDTLHAALAAAAERDIPVVLLAVGTSASGKAMVTAHSGALAGADGGWEALGRAYGIHRVTELAELADTLELFALRWRPCRPSGAGAAGPGMPGRSGRRRGIATVHDSGLERAHAVDLADAIGVAYAEIGEGTMSTLAELLDPGLVPANPLDVWGTGADTRGLFAGSLIALAQDEAVDAVALAVDLVTELDGDDAYQLAVLDAAARTGKPVAVVSNLASAIDPDAADLLRRNEIPVLEGLRTGLLALRHLLHHQRATEGRALAASPSPEPTPDGATSQSADHGHRLAPASNQRFPADGRRVAAGGRRERALTLLANERGGGEPLFALLREYGIATASVRRVNDRAGALAAGAEIGYPVVLKTDEPGIAHKSDVDGVILGIERPGQLARAYAGLAARLGPAALVCQTVPAGVELALGIVADHALGPLLVVGAGGVAVEVLADRAVALPPVRAELAGDLLAGLRIRALLDGVRGGPAADLGAVIRAITGLSELALELADQIAALDINPLICGPSGAVAVDALVVAT
jgi:acyl-CoA synthetase (NDP forming)